MHGAAPVIVAALALGACGAPAGPGGDADARVTADADAITAAPVCLAGPGRHRLFVQGHQGTPRADGRYPLLHEAGSDGADAALCDDDVFVDDTNGDGRWQPGEEPRPLGPAALVHGEHFLVGPGAYAEFAIDLCADVTGDVALYIPNYDETGSRTRHELLVRGQDGREQLIATTIDEEAGQSGYNPFVRVLAGVDPSAGPGDLLVLRSTNLSGAAFSVMVWRPPSEYESWLLVEVP
ncbi:MAG: hypothetical protein IPH80_20280 [Myxococcales bacterium]|nr:hypothetical protein [Myxococcales bacterium]